MDRTRAATLRRLLTGTPLLDRVVDLGTGLRSAAGRSGSPPGGLLLVGTPDEEPWHLAAHLGDDARRAGLPGLVPTLVRHHVPTGARPHLAVGLDRLAEAGRSSTLLVVAPDDPGEQLLQRLADARRRGSTLFALHQGGSEVAGLAHEQIEVPALPLGGATRAPELLDGSRSLEVVQHLLSVTATDTRPARASRLAALLRRPARD